MHESPDSVYVAIEVAHAYLRQAADRLYWTPQRDTHEPKNKQNPKATHAHKGIQGKCKVQPDEDRIE